MDISKSLKAAEGLWVKWKDGAEVQLRMSPKLLKELYRQSEVDGKLDDEKYEKALTEQVILDWRGITVNGGQPFPCTPENKKAMMDNVMEFATFINQTSLGLEKAEEVEAKNL